MAIANYSVTSDKPTYRLLKGREEEFDLFSQLRDLSLSDEARRKVYERIAKANMRLVMRYASLMSQKFKGGDSKGVGYDDLVGYGCLGLIRAIEKFDHTKGFKFSTYASWWIKQTMGRGIDDASRTARISVHICQKRRKIAASIIKCKEEGKPLTTENISIASGLESETVEEIQGYFYQWEHSLSLDMELGEEKGFTLAQTLRDSSQVNEPLDDLEGVITNLFNQAGLNEKEREIVRAYLGEEQRLKDIGVHYGVSKQRVHQWMNPALCKLRKAARTFNIKEVL